MGDVAGNGNIELVVLEGKPIQYICFQECDVVPVGFLFFAIASILDAGSIPVTSRFRSERALQKAPVPQPTSIMLL